MLDLMTQKAIEVLSSNFGQPPFILMVEGASIDKQSHPNQAAGVIWDTIEFDKSVGWARAWAAKRPAKDTLIVVTADHDQSMSIIGVSNTPDTEYFDRNKSEKVSFTTAPGRSGFHRVRRFLFERPRGPAVRQHQHHRVQQRRRRRNAWILRGHQPRPTIPASRPTSTYFGSPAYKLDAATGYPVNSGADIRRLAVGFRTGDHTGSSVPVTAEGPGAFLFTGYMDQTDIFFKMATAISSDTTEADKLLDAILMAHFPVPSARSKS